MIRKEEVYKIGIFNKPHGIHGELSFTFTDDILIVPIATTLFVCLTVFSFPFYGRISFSFGFYRFGKA